MLTNIFGIQIKYESWNKKKSLPIYILNSYDFYVANLKTVRCIMLQPLYELHSIPTLQKQIEKIRKIEDIPVVFMLKNISEYRRKAFIESNLPFITEKQVFLPFIGTILMEESKASKSIEKFFYSTQQLFIYYLYNNEKRLYISEASKAFPFSAMTLTRAVRQLEDSGLFVTGKTGVNKFIESKYDRLELFKKAKSYLATPIISTGYIDKTQVDKNMVFAGETALSKKTMLNASKLITYAISEKNYNKKDLNDELIDPNKQVKLEIWAYNPKQFSNDNSADDISVILSFKNTNDERIEEAVEYLQKRRLLNND